MNPGCGWYEAPAKVNLSLRVVGRRPDGYHELDGVMARLTLADALRCEPIDGVDDRLERLKSGDDDWLDRTPLPLRADNLILRAAAAYRAAAAQQGVRVPAHAWQLIKRVPVAAGLGGGSSDAAAALRLLATRYPAAIDLAGLAVGLGSDVPFFLLASPAARARGRGEVLEPLPVPPQPLVLVNPGVGVRAADAYRWWAPSGRPPTAPQRAPWWRGPAIANDLERGVAAHVGAVGATLATLRDVHPGPVAMSGSGATCFALTADLAAAETLAERLRREVPTSTWVRVCALAREA